MAGLPWGCAAAERTDPRSARAEALLRDESWTEAASLWNEIYLASSATDIDAGLRSAEAFLGGGDHASARARLEDLAARAPDRADVLRLLGAAREELGELAAARESYRRATELDPADVRSLTRLGALAAVQGDDGVPALERAVALDPGDSAARLELGLALAEVGRADEAAPHLDRAFAGGGATDGQRLRAARALGADPRIVPWLEPVARRRPEDAEVLRRIGDALMDDGRPGSAIGWLERAAKSDPTDVRALASYARALAAAGDGGAASAVLEHARALDLTADEEALLDHAEDAGARDDAADAAGTAPDGRP